jgi:hypothetical protein
MQVTIDNFSSLRDVTGVAAGPSNWLMISRSDLSNNRGASVENEGGAIIVDSSTIANKLQ